MMFTRMFSRVFEHRYTGDAGKQRYVRHGTSHRLGEGLYTLLRRRSKENSGLRSRHRCQLCYDAILVKILRKYAIATAQNLSHCERPSCKFCSLSILCCRTIIILSDSFSGLIAMSGSILSHFAVDNNPFATAKYIARKNGCPTDDTRTMVRCLRELPVKDLIKVDSELENIRTVARGFVSGLSSLLGPGPVIEGPDDER